MSAVLPDDFCRSVVPLRRRCVPTWRHLVGVGVLVLLGLTWAAFGYLTSGPRLRDTARQVLERFTDGDVEVAAAEFDLFEGIHLTQVSVAIPEHSGFFAGGASRAQREVFLAGDLYLKVNPLRLLLGGSCVSEITAVNPTFVSVKRSSDGRFNWQELFRHRRDRRGPPSVRPVLRLRNATVRTYRLRGETRAGTEMLTMLTAHVLARPRPDDPDVYNIDLWQFGGGDRAGQLAVDTTTLAFRVTAGSLPEVTIASARAALPPGAEEFEKWLTLLDLRGRVTSDDLVVDGATGTQRALIRLRDVSLSLPLTHAESEAPPEDRFVQLRSAQGTLYFEGTTARLQVQAMLRGSPCELDIEATGLEAATRDLADLGVTAHVRVKRLEVPRDADDAETALGRLISRWDVLQRALQRYGLSGVMDLEVSLAKSRGRDEPVRLEAAHFYARGVEATYHGFPYRFEDLQGEVVLNDGGLDLRDLVGRHGGARVVINGHLSDLTPQTAFDLRFEGADVDLDPDLSAALQPSHAAIYEMFNPSGRADVRVHLWRGPPSGGQSDPMKVEIDAELRNARGTFDRFPYTLVGITGGLHITRDVIELRNVRGSHGDGRATLNGWASDGGKRLDINVEAQDIAVDDELLAAVPDSAAFLLRQCGLAGRIDLNGRLTRVTPDSPTDYDLTVKLRDGGILHEALPYRLDAVNGAVRLKSGLVVIDDLSARHNDSTFVISGQFASQHEMWMGELTVHSPNLALDDDLRNALPEKLANIWKAIEITGRAAVTSHLAIGSAAGQTVCRHRTEVEALGNTVRLTALPLPMSQVSGKVTIDQREAVFDDLRSRSGEGEVRLSGRLGLQEGDRDGTFALHVENLALDEALRQAIPWRLRRIWNDVQPAGRLDLDLPSLEYTRRADGSDVWTFDGSLGLNEADLNIGLRARNLSGEITGGGRIARGGEEFELHGDLAVSSAELNGRQYEEITGEAAYTDVDGVLRLTDLAGRIHLGQVAGECEVTFGEQGTDYALSLLVRDMSLADLLNATRAEDATPLEAAGVVSGSLYLSGMAGDKASRRGGGEVLINQAQLLRLPLLLDVLEAAELKDVDPTSGQQARVKFFLQGDKLQFDRLEVRGGGLSMLGVGTLALDADRLDVTVLTAAPSEWPEVPLITEFLEGASRELMEVRIEGTLSEPQVRGRPLRSVEAALRTLFQSSRSSDQEPLDE